MNQEKYTLQLSLPAIKLSSVLSNMHQDYSNNKNHLNDYLTLDAKEECPLYANIQNNFSPHDFQTGQDFLEHISASTDIERSTKDYCNTLSYRQIVSLLKFCDAFGVERSITYFVSLLNEKLI